MKTRQDRLTIAGWDRKQAAQARIAEKSVKNSGNNIDFHGNERIIESGSGAVTISSIRIPIEQRTAPYGRPTAVATFNIPLNTKQKLLLDKLPEYKSEVIVRKKEASLADIAALTAQTGVEFAIFTKNNERLIIRGDIIHVHVDKNRALKLAAAGYKWSGHTHPGFDRNCLFASDGDLEILECFNQELAVIYNSLGQYHIFGKE